MKARHNHLVDGVEIVRLSRTDWRINDASDPERLLGYIERQSSGRFEVMWMTDPMRWGYASTFEEALAAFGTSVLFSGEILDKRASFDGRVHAAGSARRTSWVKTSRRSNVA